VSNNGDLTESEKLLLKRFPSVSCDDPIVAMASWNASLEKKVDDFSDTVKALTQAVLIEAERASRQNDLIASQNLTVQQIAKTNESFEQTLLPFQQTLSLLEEEFESLKNAILRQGRSLQSLDAQSHTLSNKLDNLSLTLKSLETLTVLNSKVNGLDVQGQALSKKLDNLSLTLKSLETLKALDSKANDLTTGLKTLSTQVDSLTKDLIVDRWVSRFALFLLLSLVLEQSLSLRDWGRSLQSQTEQVNRNVNTALLRLQRLEER